MRGIVKEGSAVEIVSLEHEPRQKQSPFGRTAQIEQTVALAYPKAVAKKLNRNRYVLDHMVGDHQIKFVVCKGNPLFAQIGFAEGKTLWNFLWLAIIHSKMPNVITTDLMCHPNDVEATTPDIQYRCSGGKALNDFF